MILRCRGPMSRRRCCIPTPLLAAHITRSSHSTSSRSSSSHPSPTSSSDSTLSSPSKPLLVLGLESSADDTCAAIVSSDRRIWSNVVVKQHEIHINDGGIHPLKAQEAHIRNMPTAISQAFSEAGLGINDIDAIAYTRGPGMYGCLTTAVNSARALAAATGKPLLGIHHMKAHALTPLLTYSEADGAPRFPMLNLLVSGGHTMLVLATKSQKSSHQAQAQAQVGGCALSQAFPNYRFKILANTVDDSIGDAFDKTAKYLQIPWIEGLGAGAGVEAYARAPTKADNLDHSHNMEQYNHFYNAIPKFKLPLPKDFSKFTFAGLKTKVHQETLKLLPNYNPNHIPPKGNSALVVDDDHHQRQILPDELKRAMARRFQEAAVGQVVRKVEGVLGWLEGEEEGRRLLGEGEVGGVGVGTLVGSGGVASNAYLREELKTMLARRKTRPPIGLAFPPVALCTDNAAMIAWAGVLKLQRQGGRGDGWDEEIRKRWSIEDEEG